MDFPKVSFTDSYLIFLIAQSRTRFNNIDFYVNDIITEVFRSQISEIFEIIEDEKLVSEELLGLKKQIDECSIEDMFDFILLCAYKNLEEKKTYISEMRIEFTFDYPYDIKKLFSLTEKYREGSDILLYLTILYSKIKLLSEDGCILEEKKFNDEYRVDMLKILQMIERTNNSKLEVKICNSNEKGETLIIDNNNGWFTNHLKDYIEDFIYDVADAPLDSYFKKISKKEGRPVNDKNEERKYYQYHFFTMISINLGENQIKNETLRMVKEFMEILGFEFDLDGRTELQYIKVMRTEIINYPKSKSTFQPIIDVQHYEDFGYRNRLKALENKETYTSVDYIEYYENHSYILDEIDSLTNENVEEVINGLLTKLHISGTILYNPVSNPLAINR